MVPGLLESPGAWAFPIGGSHSSGGSARGAYDVPPKGATVKVSFSGGNVDSPEYKGAWRGKGEQLSARPTDPKDAHRIKVYESDRFLIVLNGIGGAEELLVRDKVTGDRVSMKPAQLLVSAGQKVTVTAPAIEFNGDETAPGVARLGDSTRLRLSADDIATLAAALLATGVFTPSGSPPAPAAPVEFSDGAITAASATVKSG